MSVPTEKKKEKHQHMHYCYFWEENQRKTFFRLSVDCGTVVRKNVPRLISKESEKKKYFSIIKVVHDVRTVSM